MSRNYGLFLGLRLGSILLPLVPLRIAYALASFVGMCSFFLLARQRDAVLRNLQTVAPHASGAARRALARRVFQNDAKNWVDTLRIGRLRQDEILSSVTVHGWDHLQSAYDAGHGVILISLHLGNFDLVGQVLAAHGFHVTVPVERVEPPELFEFLQRERQSKGIHAVPAESAAREMLRGLGRGEMVAIAGDRQTAGRGVPVTLFGKRTHFPGSPASLARRSQAVVLLGVGVRLSNDRFAGFIEAPLRFQRTDNREDDLIANTQRLADAMQGYIRRYPDQWLVFTPVWPTEIDRVATIEQPRGAAV